MNGSQTRSARINYTPALRKPGLDLRLGLTFEEWQDIGSTLAWALADWAWYGDWDRARFWLHKAAAGMGLSADALTDLGVVAGRFTRERRRPDLTLGHHMKVQIGSDAEQDRRLRAFFCRQCGKSLPPNARADMKFCRGGACSERARRRRGAGLDEGAYPGSWQGKRLTPERDFVDATSRTW